MSNLAVDIENGSAINFTLAGMFNMNPGTCATALGYIIDPNGQTWAGIAPN